MPMSKGYQRILLPVVELVLFWQVLAMILKTPALPYPHEALWRFIHTGELMEHTWASLWRVLRAIVGSAGLAVPLGLWVGGSKVVFEMISPLLYLLYPIPKVAFLPVIMLVLGLGDAAKIFLMMLVIFFQILIAVVDARKGIDKHVIDSIATLGPTRWQLLRHVLLPAVLPRVLTAVRVSIGTSLAVLFFAETFGTELGLGYYITDAWMRLNYKDMFAGIIALSILGLGLFQSVNWLEAKLCRWRSL